MINFSATSAAYIFKCTSSLLFLLILIACSNQISNKSSSNELNEIYKNLYLVHNSPDFPGDAEVFTHCASTSNEGCYKVIKLVERAILKLKTMDHKDALALAINTIKNHCKISIHPNNLSEPLCEGALTSLYFFNEVEDDTTLLNEFKTFGFVINREIFNRNKAWYYNRKSTQTWEEYIKSTLTADELDLQLWRFSQKEIKAFGLMYFEVPISSNTNLTY